jgi:hypothetical protein
MLIFPFFFNEILFNYFIFTEFDHFLYPKKLPVPLCFCTEASSGEELRLERQPGRDNYWYILYISIYCLCFTSLY